MGQLDRAAEHFEAALSFCRKGGYRPELAWTCCDYADMLLSRNSPGNRQKALPLLDESLSITRDLGMRPLMEKVIVLQEQADSAVATRRVAPAYPDGLSQRELEVLRLIALGKSNREIAEGLIISLRTVANHVINILNKTNTANRTEAATYASRHGLV